MAPRKPIRWLTSTTVASPPFGPRARQAIGTLLRRIQEGDPIGMPASRPMPVIGKHCHELRVHDPDENAHRRIVYRIDSDAIVVASWFEKKTQKLPPSELALAKRRLREYDHG